MTKVELKNLIDAAAGRRKADLVIKNCKIVNVLSGEISSGEVAIADGKIIGFLTRTENFSRRVSSTGISISNRLTSAPNSSAE